MAKNPPSQFPLWARSLGAMLDDSVDVRVGCDRCGHWRDVDIAALAARVGRDYSLVDRRCRCRLKPTCKGWNRFYYLHGVFRPLWSEARSAHWMLADTPRRR